MRRLHELFFIADVETARRLEVDLVDVVDDFVSAGGRMVSLRGGGADDQSLMQIGREISGLVFAAAGTFLVHRRIDLARLLGADGVHLPAKGFTKAQAQQLMGEDAMLGRSCHERDEVENWDRLRGSFCTLGPVFESVSKPGYGPHLAPEEFGDLSRAVEIPVYALGGVVPENVGDCLDAGAFGVAVVGGIMGAKSPFEATLEYVEAIDRW